MKRYILQRKSDGFYWRKDASWTPDKNKAHVRMSRKVLESTQRRGYRQPVPGSQWFKWVPLPKEPWFSQNFNIIEVSFE